MTEAMKARGPVCECIDPGCFIPLPISWEQHERESFAYTLIADSCRGERDYLQCIEQKQGYGLYVLAPDYNEADWF